MMTLRDHQSTGARYISFANGFPCKEMVPPEEHPATVNMRGGFFVGLHDGATSCMTKSHKVIPPLARKRANTNALKPRASSSRYKSKGDPFAAHKGTEKLGFTPQSIKHSKPKVERTSPRTEPIPSTSAVVDLRLGTKLCRPTEQPVLAPEESDVTTKPAENYSSLILTDVENPRTLDELVGIEEVYQRVCNGNMSSLSSLISPVKTKRKFKQTNTGYSTQYLQTSSPLQLKQKPLLGRNLQKDGSKSADHVLESESRSKKISTKQSILVPLPYFANPKPPNTAPARLRETYNYPKIYASRQERQRPYVISSLSGWSSPSIINFNPAVDLPEIRPISRMCAPTGSIIGVQNKSQTGKVAIVAALDATATPPATAQSEAIQQGLDNDNHGEPILSKPKSPDIDSLYSEGEPNTLTQTVESSESDKQVTQEADTPIDQTDIRTEENLINGGKDTAVDSLATVFSVQFNVTDESGQINDVEIYDPESRDLEKEEKINKEIEEAQENYQKKRHELETLLDEHDHLVQELNELTKESH